MDRPFHTQPADTRPESRDSFHDALSSNSQDVQLPRFREFDFYITSNLPPPVSNGPASTSNSRLPSLAQTLASNGSQLDRIPSFSELAAGNSTSSSRSYHQTPMNSNTSVINTPMAPGSRTNSFHDNDNIKLVAQALADLKAAPSPQVPTSEPAGKRPLLDVITSTHPLIASTVNRTNQAYNSSKNFSPRFKSTAEYMESCLHPFAHTVQNVGRVTGVEGGFRWILGDRGQTQPTPITSSPQEQIGSSKRRKANDGASVAASEDGDYYERRMSMISNSTTSGLLYEDSKPPSYVTSPQHPSPDVHYNQPHQRERPKNMTMRFIRSTAGLSTAINTQSMHSMKYCLAMMRRANKNIEDHVTSLTNLIQEYDLAEARELEAKRNAENDGDPGRRDSIDDVDMQSVTPAPEPTSQAATPTAAATPTTTQATTSSTSNSAPRTRREVGERVQRLKSEVASVLNDIMGKISIYAGSVLPPGARDVVRRSLVSLPGRAIGAQKMQAAAEQEAIQRGEVPSHRSRTRMNAQMAITLAREGLNMLLQISNVLDTTIGSAEEWCDRMGKNRAIALGQAGQQGQQAVYERTSRSVSQIHSAAVSVNGNVIMEGNEEIRPPTTAEKRPLEA